MSEDNNAYGSLLFRREWKEKREKILQRDGYKCRICGSTDNLQVHHKQYHFNKVTNRKCLPWEYDDKYLVTLCDSCHSRGHAKYEIPTKYIK